MHVDAGIGGPIPVTATPLHCGVNDLHIAPRGAPRQEDKPSMVAPALRLLCLPFLALLAAAIGTTSPAAADEAALPYELPPADSSLSGGREPGPVVQPAPIRYAQDRGDIDDSILLPAARDRDEDGDRRWARDHFAVAAGVISVPSYNGSDERTVLPAFYLRGRVSGFAFSTRGTNFQVDLIRQKRGQRTDFKFCPIIGLRSDRTGRIKDAQVEALGERKLAVEAGLAMGVIRQGVFTSRYDQLGVRVVGLADVSGRHGSWFVSPTIDYGTPLSKRAYVGVSASLNIYGKGFGRYYYDVDPLGSAASGLPVYDRAGRKATAGKYTIGLAGAWALSGDLRKGFVLLGGAQYGRMTGRFAASPIVRDAGSADQWVGGVGIAYQF